MTVRVAVPTAAATLAAADPVDELIRSYTELVGWLRRELRNAEDAADVAQSSFVRVLRPTVLAAADCPRALLFRTAQRLCTDLHRRRTAAGATLRTWALLHDAQTLSTEHTVLARDALRRVLERLAALPPRRRDVFVQVRVFGRSHAEVADALGLTRAAIEKHVVRATLDLSDALDDGDGVSPVAVADAPPRAATAALSAATAASAVSPAAASDARRATSTRRP
jgi:RNA polymerase sigma-70 factor (ECF subfamily)